MLVCVWVFYNCVSVCLLQLSTLVALPRFRHLSHSLSLCQGQNVGSWEIREDLLLRSRGGWFFSRLRWFSCFYLVSTLEIMQTKKQIFDPFPSSWFEHLGIRIVRFTCAPLSIFVVELFSSSTGFDTTTRITCSIAELSLFVCKISSLLLFLSST